LVNDGPRHVCATGDSKALGRPSYEPVDPPYGNDHSFKNLTLAISATGYADMSVATMSATLLWLAMLGELVDDRDDCGPISEQFTFRG
jgi:hypothetical protein